MPRKGATGGKQRRMGTIDLETGEIFDGGIPVWVGAKVRWAEDWFMGFQQAFVEVATDRDFTGEVLRVWLYMLGKLGFENYIALEQKEISEDLGINRPNVSRAMKVLTDKKLILKGPRIGRIYSYRLNSKYGWKGKVVNLQKERRESEKERQQAMEEAWAEIDEKKRKDLIRDAQKRHFQKSGAEIPDPQGPETT